MRGASREFRRRGYLLCLTLLLFIGLGAASSAHDASHGEDHGDHGCVACHVPALEAPVAPAPIVRPLLPVSSAPLPDTREEGVARRTHRIPRAPPAR